MQPSCRPVRSHYTMDVMLLRLCKRAVNGGRFFVTNCVNCRGRAQLRAFALELTAPNR